jgi:hypothetical protein
MSINIFSVLLLNSVYIIFFTVQVFFNFDSTVDSIYSSSDYSKTCSFKKPIHSSQKANFRLNKRFQPKSILLCHSLNMEVPTKCVRVIQPITGYMNLLPVPTNANQSLRGPPVQI